MDTDYYMKTCRAVLMTAFLTLCVTISAEARVVINEFVTSNTVILDEDGDSSDWIELYNSGSQPVNLMGYGLSDDRGDSFKWVFPEYDMQPGEYLLVFASGKDRRTPSPYFHTSFGLSANDDAVRLTPQDQSYNEEVLIIEIPRNLSYGRHSNGEFELYRDITPGARNGRPLLLPPEFANKGGFYNNRATVSISHPKPGVTIRMTRNGRRPTNSSNRYTGTFRVTETTTVRAMATKSGFENSPIAGETFFINFDSQGYPIVHIATEEENLWSPSTGIFPGEGDTSNTTPNNLRGERRPIHLEYYDPSGNQMISQGAEIQVIGASSRNEWFRPIKLTANAAVDPLNPWFVGPILKSGFERYRHFQIRNNNQDSFKTVNPNPYARPTLGIRNSLMANLFRSDPDFEMRDDNGAVLIFVNGFNFGIGNFGEKRDNSTIQTRHPEVDGDDVDMVVLRDNEFEIGMARPDNTVRIWDYYNLAQAEYEEVSDRAVSEGGLSGLTDFFAMIDYIRGNSLRDPSRYAYVESMLDIPTFITGTVAQILAANFDYPNNNIAFWRNYPQGGEAGPWHLYNYDFDATFALFPDLLRHDTLSHMVGQSQILPSLLSNDEFKHAFIRKFDHYLNGVFQTQNTHAVVEQLRAQVAPWVQHYLELWADRTLDFDGWRQNVDWLKRFLSERPADMRHYVEQYFGLGGSSRINIVIDDPMGGKVLMDTAVFREEMPSTGRYFNRTPLNLVAVNNRGYGFVGFQIGGNIIPDRVYTMTPGGNLTITALFEPDPTAPAAELVVNEMVNSGDQQIMDEDGEETDWIEILNTAPYPIDLGGKYLTDEPNDPTQWEFPELTLGPGEFLVVYASGKDRRDPASNLHTNFRLSGGNNDPVYLFDDNGRDVIDAMRFVEVEGIENDHSGGRFPDGSTQFSSFPVATPGAPNIAPPEPAVINQPPIGTRLSTADILFGWSSGVGVESYQLNVGRTGALFQFRESSEFIFSQETTDTSVLATGLPQDGGNVFVRLWSKIGGSWVAGDVFTYRTQAPAAQISSSSTPTFAAADSSHTIEPDMSAVQPETVDQAESDSGPSASSNRGEPTVDSEPLPQAEAVSIESPGSTSTEPASASEIHEPKTDMATTVSDVAETEVFAVPVQPAERGPTATAGEEMVQLAKVSSPEPADIVIRVTPSDNQLVAPETPEQRRIEEETNSTGAAEPLNKIIISGVGSGDESVHFDIGADQQWAASDSPVVVTLLADSFMELQNISGGTVNVADLGITFDSDSPLRLVQITGDDLILIQPEETLRIYFVEGVRNEADQGITVPDGPGAAPYVVALYSSNTMTMLENNAVEKPRPMVFARNDKRFADKVVVFSIGGESGLLQGSAEYYSESLTRQ